MTMGDKSKYPTLIDKITKCVFLMALVFIVINSLSNSSKQVNVCRYFQTKIEYFWREQNR